MPEVSAYVNGSVCMAFPGGRRRGSKTGEPPRLRADHRFGLAERRVVRGDDEVGALGELAASSVGDPVDGGEDRLAQLTQRVERAVEVLRWRSQSSLVMSLRCRRSLPTENARSPAPVMIATRTWYGPRFFLGPRSAARPSRW